MNRPIQYCLIFFFLVSCQNKHELETETLFTLLPENKTNIYFDNRLTPSNEYNIFKYRNFYQGGGVGLGDINNDGLLDIYLTANMQPNKLYLNKGDFVFEDITESAGVAGKQMWSSGVSMVDINADGWLDIYVCNSGNISGDNKLNELFVNNGDGTFTDRAQEMGIADKGFSTHAAFFDFDKDGDLDLYQLNNSYRSIGSFNLKENDRPIRDHLGGDKLYRNDDGIFKDISEEAGIYGSVIGFGLGVAVADLNNDGWQDIYISNDFFERDYIYMNNGDGTFTESLTNLVKATSLTSMGVDIADLTGDGYPEIFVNDMLPETDDRYKTTMTFENWDKYQNNVRNGYYHQFTRNTLQLNNGLVKGADLSFSEVGRMANVEATDWSWTALLTDLDNNGDKDIFITNGIDRDILDQDFIQYIANEEVTKMVVKKEGVDYYKLLDLIPSHLVPNYAYAGNGRLKFNNVTKEWGLDKPSSSNGAAYGDLDNDGDLDLIVNNVNQPVFVYKNNSDTVLGNNYLKLNLVGELQNIQAVGAKVTVKVGDKMYWQEQFLNRGFQSSVDNRMNFGLGNATMVDTLKVQWYYGKETVLVNVNVNQTLDLYESKAFVSLGQKLNNDKSIFEELSSLNGLNFKHQEEAFVDFDQSRLLFHMSTTEGAKISIADVNGDGLDDLFFCGGKNQTAELFNQTKKSFVSSNHKVFNKNKKSEDIASLFFDADSDGDLDLYVASGSSEFAASSFSLVDRLYLNDGKGNYKISSQSLPVVIPQNTSTVSAADYDKDGDLDLFVGVRMKSNNYGIPQTSFLLENNGSGNFKSVTEEKASGLIEIGMVTDALWVDIDNDNDKDLIVVGEWMGVKCFENDAGNFEDISHKLGLSDTKGWWNKIITSDFNYDGRPDFVLGNHGLNSRFNASKEQPIYSYVNDFDQNGDIEQILCQFNGGTSFPMILRHDLVAQLPILKKNILKYHDYKGKTINDLFSKKQLEASIVNKVNMLESIILLSTEHNKYKIEKLPLEAQLAPVYAIIAKDFDSDGLIDIITAGNLYGVKPEVGRYDASYGAFLKGNGKGTFQSVPMDISGLVLHGEIRDLQFLNFGGEKILVVTRTNDKPQFFKINSMK